MIEALVLPIAEGKNLPVSLEMSHCLHELVQTTGVSIIHGFVPNETKLLSLRDVVRIINGEKEAPELSFSLTNVDGSEVIIPGVAEDEIMEE